MLTLENQMIYAKRQYDALQLEESAKCDWLITMENAQQNGWQHTEPRMIKNLEYLNSRYSNVVGLDPSKNYLYRNYDLFVLSKLNPCLWHEHGCFHNLLQLSAITGMRIRVGFNEWFTPRNENDQVYQIGLQNAFFQEAFDLSKHFSWVTLDQFSITKLQMEYWHWLRIKDYRYIPKNVNCFSTPPPGWKPPPININN